MTNKNFVTRLQFTKYFYTKKRLSSLFFLYIFGCKVLKPLYLAFIAFQLMSFNQLHVYILFIDIDECSTNNGGCSHHCYNIPGSFYCGCPEGTTMASNNLTCVGKCGSKPRIKCKLKYFDKIFSAKLIIDTSLISEPGVSVACDENNMTVSLEKQTFPFFNVSSLHLRYSSCRQSIFLVLNTTAMN